MSWSPKIVISPIVAPSGSNVLDLTALTGHLPGGIPLMLPSGGDWLRCWGANASTTKFSGGHITATDFNEGGGALPTHGPGDWNLVVFTDGAGGGFVQDSGPTSQHGDMWIAPADASVNCGRRIVGPASRANSRLCFQIKNYGTDLHARVSLSDGSFPLTQRVLPKAIPGAPDGVDASFCVDYCAAGPDQTVTVDVYCASRIAGAVEQVLWDAVWMPVPVPAPRARAWPGMQMLVGAMGEGRGSL